jgi:hypothetical protein
VPVASGNKQVCASMAFEGCGKLQQRQQCKSVTFTGARDACAKMGARLCTSEELSANVAIKAGSKLSAERVWAAEECPFVF